MQLTWLIYHVFKAVVVGLTLASVSFTQTSKNVNVSPENTKVCRGTDHGLSHREEPQLRYERYRTVYTNCTHVDGNLEIVYLGDDNDVMADYDLGFLSSIREITGYVLIVANYVNYVPLTGLRIIRGRTLYEQEGRFYSLYIVLNYSDKMPGVGLKELRFTSLHEIMAGSVFFYNNNQLCYEDTINWADILAGRDAYGNRTEVVYQKDGTDPRRTCKKCDASCQYDTTPGSCWGQGPEFCQKLTRVTCSSQCDGRCFGPAPNQCCHPECAGGCNGQSKKDCWACRNFVNDGSCEAFCPPEYIYSQSEYRQVPNPNAKYSYGALCVQQCPVHLIADKGHCVMECDAGRIAGKKKKVPTATLR